MATQPRLRHHMACFYQPKRLPKIPLGHCKTLVFGAHQDDVEILGQRWAFDAYSSGARDFFGVVVANGAGKKPRSPRLTDLSTAAMCRLRNNEQKVAADIGEYGGCFMLSHASDSIRHRRNQDVVDEFREILMATTPEIVVTHNPIDLHTTHIGVYHHVTWAVQSLPQKKRPKFFYGGEVWGDMSRWHVALNGRAGTELIDSTNSLEFLTRLLGPFISQNDIMGYNSRIPMLLRLRAGLMDPYENTGMTAVQIVFNMNELISGKMTPAEYRQRLMTLHHEHIDAMHAGYE